MTESRQYTSVGGTLAPGGYSISASEVILTQRTGCSLSLFALYSQSVSQSVSQLFPALTRNSVFSRTYRCVYDRMRSKQLVPKFWVK